MMKHRLTYISNPEAQLQLNYSRPTVSIAVYCTVLYVMVDLSHLSNLHFGQQQGKGKLVRSRKFIVNFQIIRRALSISNLPLRIMKAPYECFTLVKDLQQCLSIASEMGREPGTNASEPNALSLKLTSLILKGSSNVTQYSIHTRNWSLHAQTFERTRPTTLIWAPYRLVPMFNERLGISEEGLTFEAFGSQVLDPGSCPISGAIDMH